MYYLPEAGNRTQ